MAVAAVAAAAAATAVAGQPGRRTGISQLSLLICQIMLLVNMSMLEQGVGKTQLCDLPIKGIRCSRIYCGPCRPGFANTLLWLCLPLLVAIPIDVMVLVS